MINLKSLLSKILDWLSGKNPIYTTDALEVRGTTGKDIGFRAYNADTDLGVSFEIGSGGSNHGIYSHKLDAWLIYGNGSSYGYNCCRVYRTPTIATIADIITVNSTAATITSANYTERAGVASLNITWTNKSAISVPANGNISNVTVGTVVAGKRPAISIAAHSYGDNAGAAWYSFSTAGVISLGACEGTGAARTINAGSSFQCCVTYLLE